MPPAVKVFVCWQSGAWSLGEKDFGDASFDTLHEARTYVRDVQVSKRERGHHVDFRFFVGVEIDGIPPDGMADDPTPSGLLASFL